MGNRDLGEISVILGVIFRGLKIRARSRRDCGCLSYLGGMTLISARSRRVNRDLGEISVILVENFSGQKISARSRRGRRDLGEISVILGEIFRGRNTSARSRRDCGCLFHLGEIRSEIFRGHRDRRDLAETSAISTRKPRSCRGNHDLDKTPRSSPDSRPRNEDM